MKTELALLFIVAGAVACGGGGGEKNANDAGSGGRAGQGGSACPGCAASERFHDNCDQTVTDCQTNLMWVKSPPAGEVSWKQAYAACEALTLAGHTDWYLPTKSELLTLYSGPGGTGPTYAGDGCYFDQSAFAGTCSQSKMAFYSTSSPSSKGMACLNFAVDTYSGSEGLLVCSCDETNVNYYRCVRAGSGAGTSGQCGSGIPSGTGGSGGSCAGKCSSCLGSCRGLSGCCCGSGCMCDSVCTSTCGDNC